MEEKNGYHCNRSPCGYHDSISLISDTSMVEGKKLIKAMPALRVGQKVSSYWKNEADIIVLTTIMILCHMENGNFENLKL